MSGAIATAALSNESVHSQQCWSEFRAHLVLLYDCSKSQWPGFLDCQRKGAETSTAVVQRGPAWHFHVFHAPISCQPGPSAIPCFSSGRQHLSSSSPSDIMAAAASRPAQRNSGFGSAKPCGSGWCHTRLCAGRVSRLTGAHFIKTAALRTPGAVCHA
jgi:hypothetical protein